MEIYELLRRDHKAVAEMFKKIENTTELESRGRKDLFSTLRAELLAHAQAEQEVLYSPLLERVGDRDLVLEAFEEHRSIELMFDEVERCPIDDERWLAKLTVLREIVEHHVEEEEGELFKVARKHLSREEAKAIGERMLARKAELVG